MANNKNKKKQYNVKKTNSKRKNNSLKKEVKATIIDKNNLEANKKIEVSIPKESNEKPLDSVTKNTAMTNKMSVKGKAKKPIPKKKIDEVKKDNITSVADEIIEKIENVDEVKHDELSKKTEDLTQEEISAKRKERNRKKYEKGQKKYRENQEKKKIILDEEVELENKKEEKTIPETEVVEETITRIVTIEEELVRKTPEEGKSLEKEKEQERKEKRKINRKTSGFTQTLSNIKEASVNKINDVREKTADDTIPLGKTFDEKSKRSKRLIKEAIVYAIILTIINVLCIVIFDYFNFLRLFDIKALNIILTIIISLIFNFFVAFMVDYFVTNVWASKKRKKKDGEQNGDSGVIKGKNRKNIKNKKRK